MNNIFLGEPVQEIKNWFVENFPSWPKETTLTFTEASGKPLELKLIEGEATWENIGVKTGHSSSDNTLKSCKLGNIVTEISSHAFYQCESLISINIPDSVTSIGDEAFSWCRSLTSVNIPSSVTSIGGNAFSWCPSLTSVNIPNSVSSIEVMAFSGCYSLPSIDIPNSVTSIGDMAFSFCSSLPSITIPSSVISIGNDPFTGIANANCGDFRTLTSIIFAGRTIEQVQAMEGYPWEIDDISIISAELS